MPFAEVKAELEKDPAILKEVASSFKDSLTKELEGSGFIIRTKEQDEQYLKAQIDAGAPARFAEAYKKAYDLVDSSVKELTGLEKGDNEKTTEYISRAIAELKKSGGGDAATKQQVEQLQNMLKQTKTEYEQKLSEKEQELFNREQDFQLNTALEKYQIAVPAHLTKEEDRQSYISNQRRLIAADFRMSLKGRRDDAGNIIYQVDGKDALSTKDGKPLTAADLIAERYASYFVPAGKQAQGSGGAGSPGGGTGQYKSLDDISKVLQAEGIRWGSTEYLNRFEALAKESGLKV